MSPPMSSSSPSASLPLTLYEGYFREHAYGLSNQNFVAWLGDFAIGFAVTLVAALIVAAAALCRHPRGAGDLVDVGRRAWRSLFQILVAVIYPVFIAPLFNHYSPLPDSPLKAQILSLARANDIPADNVWLVDASRQSNRISANVSGFLGTTRISLNDNLLKQGTPDEVLAVLGHEMGHYVMGHTTRGILLLLGLVIVAGFRFRRIGVSGSPTDIFGGQLAGAAGWTISRACRCWWRWPACSSS